MPRDIVRRAKAVPAASMLALALGAAAFGAVAVGALAIGRLALGRVTVKRARFQTLEVDELTVRKLRVREVESPPPRARSLPDALLHEVLRVRQRCGVARSSVMRRGDLVWARHRVF